VCHKQQLSGSHLLGVHHVRRLRLHSSPHAHHAHIELARRSGHRGRRLQQYGRGRSGSRLHYPQRLWGACRAGRQGGEVSSEQTADRQAPTSQVVRLARGRLLPFPLIPIIPPFIPLKPQSHSQPLPPPPHIPFPSYSPPASTACALAQKDSRAPSVSNLRMGSLSSTHVQVDNLGAHHARVRVHQLTQ
jgi:hypothetical protein